MTPGARRADRQYLEFVVDGQPLGGMLEPFLGYPNAMQEYVSVLVTDWPDGIPEADIDRLLGADKDPCLDGRVALYVCVEYGDLGCGGVTAVVEVAASHVVWRDFGHQNSHEPFDHSTVFRDVGPFTFDRPSYTRVLNAFRHSFPGPATT